MQIDFIWLYMLKVDLYFWIPRGIWNCQKKNKLGVSSIFFCECYLLLVNKLLKWQIIVMLVTKIFWAYFFWDLNKINHYNLGSICFEISHLQWIKVVPYNICFARDSGLSRASALENAPSLYVLDICTWNNTL